MKKGILYLNYLNNVEHSIGIRWLVSRTAGGKDISSVDRWVSALAPMDKVFNNYKSGIFSFKELTACYLNQLLTITASKKAIHRLTNMLNEGLDITVICHESKYPCHRYILGKYIESLGYKVVDLSES